MLSDEIAKAVFELPAKERLELARRLVESVVFPATLTSAAVEGIKRIEDMASGRVKALSESEFRARLN